MAKADISGDLDRGAAKDVARQRRRVREAELLAQARASAAAGRVVSEAQVDAWIDSLGTDRELTAPRSGR